MSAPMLASSLAVLVVAAATLATAPEAAAEGGGPPPCAALDLSLSGLGSAADDLSRVAELAGQAPLTPRVLRRLSGERPQLLCPGSPPAEPPERAPAPEPEWTLVPPTSFSRLLTGWSDDRNDGALFAGRGLSTALSAGVRLRWALLTAQLAPQLSWQQNRDFARPVATIAGRSPYSNPFNGGIDLPLVMGRGPFWSADPGQSFVRADAFGVGLGLSTESLWWGPGARNTLLMTNSAAGLPHLFLGTSRPVDVWIGRLEAEVMWGRLSESRVFDFDPGNDRRLFEALTASFAPALAPGLTLGYVRVFLFPNESVGFHHYFDPIVQPLFKAFLKSGSDDGSRPDNQLTSIFFRWAFPPVGLEIYAEYGRDDHAFNLIDLLEEPGHSSAWMLGLQKLFPAGRRWVRLHFELAHTFEMPTVNPTRGTPVFYNHAPEIQGYTQRGQMLGAGIGPQADTQFLAVDWFRARGRVGVFVERLVRHERYFYDVVSTRPEGALRRHDLQMTFGLRGSRSWTQWDLEWELAGAHRYALDFEHSAPGAQGLLKVSWWPGRAAPPPDLAPRAAAVP